jgi:hypothetical protein
MRHRAQMLEGRLRGLRDRPERVRVDGIAGKLAGEGQGEGDRLLLESGLARVGIREHDAA